jgi:amidase
MSDLTTFSAKKLANLIQRKQVSCLEVMRAHLDRIATINPLINALVQVLPTEVAFEQARAADTVFRRDPASCGKLHGVPVSIKDGRKVKGFVCSLGNKSPLNRVATEDATVVARLRAAGAIVVGISNIPDFSMSYETDNWLYGRTNNPYDIRRSPGGSSGGEAAIIAAGGSALGIGADSGGSIRQPAHNCGIAAIKPTRGLLPNTGKFPSNELGIFSYVEVQGPFARSVDDLTYVLPILAGPDGHDPYIEPMAVRDPAHVDLQTLRLAFYTDNGIAAPRADIGEMIKQVATAISPHVASINEAVPGISKETYEAFEELFFYGGDRGQWLHDRMQVMHVTQVAGPFQAILDRAARCEFSVTEFRYRLLALDGFKFQMMDFYRDYDVIICPVATGPASFYEKELAAKEGFDMANDLTYNLPYNIMGWPAAVVRCGTSKEGLPLGVQIVAKSWRDDIALAVARRLEEIFGGWQTPPLPTENHIRA